MKIEKKLEEKFDFGSISERDKKLVSEIIDYVKSKGISKEICESILQKFQVKELPVYDLEKSHFIRHLKKCKLYYNDQGFIREGEYPKIIKYPIVSVQCDIRDFEKLYASILEDGIKIGKELKK